MYHEYTIQIETRDPETGYKPFNVYLNRSGEIQPIYTYQGKSLKRGLTGCMKALDDMEAEERN
jgi:hypothetical protein